MTWTIHNGDCLEVLRTLADCSIDSVVTDPPYGLSFMGKRWDYDVPGVDVWAECLRVLKPGGHLLAFAGTRTQHRVAVRIEDAGFEIRDMIAWVYGSGFPKSHDVSKAIDKLAGVEREVVGVKKHSSKQQIETFKNTGDYKITAPATPEAKQWQGWGTALKPALEPITVARKPLAGTVAENVLTHGTGGINVDGCRVLFHGEADKAAAAAAAAQRACRDQNQNRTAYGEFNNGDASLAPYLAGLDRGRWPANLIHDGSDEVVGLFPDSNGSGNARTLNRGDRNDGWGMADKPGELRDAGSGSAARFFYCAKASKADRDEGNRHPTVKPAELMRYLCRLVTPPSGVVLDPFTGSGSTGKAAILERFNFIGIEREAEYCEIARARISKAEREIMGQFNLG